MTCVATPVSLSWAQHLPHAAASTTVTWTATFDLFAPLPAPASASTSNAFASTSAAGPKQRPTLRLPLLAASDLPARRFDPFADEPVASTSTSQSQNTPPARGRALTPLVLSTPTPAPATTPTKGRRRAPSFSAGSGSPRSTCIVLSTPAPASTPASAPSVPGAPTPFHARHYPTPDARARLLARTLLNRIHAVGRPRSPYFSVASSPYYRSSSSASGIRGGASRCNGTESECGRRGYVPSRLSECVAAC